jgi:predicted aspartyl protease
MKTNTSKKAAPCFALLCCLSAPLVLAQPTAGQESNSFSVTFKLQQGKIMVPASLNGSEPLSFLLDTGFGVTTLHPDLPERLNLRRAGRVTIVGIAGEEQAPTYAGAAFNIGGASYTPRRVAALPSQRNRRRDGVLGAGLFRRFAVEIEFTSQQLRLHEPKGFVHNGAGAVVPLRFKSAIPVITAGLRTARGTNVQAEFEIDTGCDSGLCLGQSFVERQQLLEGSGTRDSAKFGVGGDVRTRRGAVSQLQIGHHVIERPQTDFFLEGSPVDDPLAGHIGMGALRRFKRAIFDYSRRQLILEK